MRPDVLNATFDAFRDLAKTEAEKGVPTITICDVTFVIEEIDFAKADNRMVEIQENGDAYIFDIDDVKYARYTIK